MFEAVIQNAYLRIMFSSAVVYLFIVIAIRLFGKKELAQLSVIDLVFILLISNAVQNAMTGPDFSLRGGLVAAGTLFAVNYLFKNMVYFSPKFSRFMQGSPLLLIYKGVLNKENMEKYKITYDELMEVIREHGVSSISEVDLAVLEVDGNISVLSDEFRKKTIKRRKSHKIISKSQA